MKKILFTAIGCALFSVQGYCQRYYTNEPSGAILFAAGLNNSRTLHDTASYASVKTPLGGLLYSRVINDRFNLDMGVMYAAKGYNYEKYHTKNRFFYIEIPLYAQYKLSEDVRFDLGAQYSIFTSGISTFPNGDTGSGKDHVSINDSPDDNYYSMIAGVDIKLNDHFDLTAHYTRSLETFQNKVGFDSFELHLHYYMLRFYGHGKKEETPGQ